MNVLLSKRDFSGVLPADKFFWQAERLEWRAVGGPWLGRLRASAGPGGLARLWDLANWLRCGVTVSDELGPAWWGYVCTVELHLGARVVRLSLEDVWNRIMVSYYQYTPASAGGYRSLTGLYQNADSIRAYGYKERVFIAKQMSTPAQAGAYANTLINRYGLPVAVAQVDPAEVESVEPYAIVECRGWWETLDWRFYNDNRGQAGYLTGGSRTLLGAAAGQSKLAQFFTPASVGWAASEVWVKLVKVGAPLDNVRVDLCANNGGFPGTSLANGSMAGPAIGTDGAEWYKFTLSGAVTLAANTSYWVQLTRSGAVDAVNFYAWLTDSAAGNVDSYPEYWNGSAWGNFPVNLDFAFMVTGYQDNALQMARICDATAGCGQFLSGFRFEPGTTGINSKMYRDGSTRGRQEIEELLQIGTSAGLRLLANVDKTRLARVYVQPGAPAAGKLGLVIGPQGEIAHSDGTSLPLSEQPAGQWARLGELAAAGDIFGYSGAVFIEGCAWDGKILKVIG